jgi:hypothetical protein
MRKKKLFLCLITVILLIVSTSCDDSDWHYSISVPYAHSTTNMSAAWAIHLWSLYDGIGTSEEIIESQILNPDGTPNHWYMELAIDQHTNSYGYFADYPWSDIGQNQAISGLASSLKYDSCSIITLYGHMYAPVVEGRGHYDDYKMVADALWVHEEGLERSYYSVAELKYVVFQPINGDLVTFLGRRKYEDWGLADYQTFLNNNGTFLGAPKNYEPSTDPMGQ